MIERLGTWGALGLTLIVIGTAIVIAGYGVGGALILIGAVVLVLALLLGGGRRA